MPLLLQDIQNGLRSLVSTPAFLGLAVLCLGFGIGANTWAFSIVNRLALQPAPFPSAQQMVALYEYREVNPSQSLPASYPNFLDWREALESSGELAALKPRFVVLRGDFEPERITAAEITPNLFEVLGVPPLHGRHLRDDEAGTGAGDVVLLGETFWRQRHDANPAAVGQQIRIEGRLHTIVGVVPHFAQPALPAALRDARLWIPMRPDSVEGRRDDRSLHVVGRLSEDGAYADSAARLAALARTLAELHPENEGWQARMQPFAGGLGPQNVALLHTLFAAVAFVLLIACANVANMLLARSLRRRREMAMRIALGAPGLRIVRLHLVESLLIGLLAVPIGVLFASWGIELLVAAGPEQVQDEALSIDAAALVFTVAVALATSLIFGTVPALRASRVAPRDVLGDGGRSASSGPGPRGHRSALVVGQVALALMLLVCASLFVRSFMNLMQSDSAFETESLLVLGIQLPEDPYAAPERAAQRVDDLLDRMSSSPGVQAVAASAMLPLRFAAGRGTAWPGDTATNDGTPGLSVGFAPVTSEFFAALNLPLEQGAAWADAEAATPVAVVNRTLAERLWGNGGVVGEWLRLSGGGVDLRLSVVGVAPDLANWDQSNQPLPTVFLPHALAPVLNLHLLARVDGDPASAASPMRSAILAADPDISVYSTLTMEEVHRAAFWRQQLAGTVLASIAALAMLLAVGGVFGVLSYLAANRTAELGVRVALGATGASIARLVLRQGATLILTGIVLGTVGAVGMMRLLQGQLYGVSATDAWLIAGAAAVVAAGGLVATLLPARSAARVDAAALLRRV